MRGLNHVTVDEIRRIIHIHLSKETIIHVETCGRCLIDPTRTFSKRRDIVAVFGSIHEIAKSTILTFGHSKTLLHIAHIVEIITYGILYLCPVNKFFDILLWKIHEKLPTFSYIAITEDLFHFFFVRNFCELLIHETILFAHQVAAKKAVLATDTAIEEPAITTIDTVSAIKKFLWFLALNTLKTLLAMFTETAIECVFAMRYTRIVIAFFIEIRVEDEITIPTIAHVIGIIRVFKRWNLLDMNSRDSLLKIIILCEKWLWEIKFSPVVCRIILIGEPKIPWEYRVFCLTFVVWNEFFSCGTAFPLIELSLVTKGETSLLPLFRAELRSRDLVFLSKKSGRDLVIEFQIFIGDDEFFAWNETFFDFDDFLGRENRIGHKYIK